MILAYIHLAQTDSRKVPNECWTPVAPLCNPLASTLPLSSYLS